METSLDLIWKRQILIKLADRRVLVGRPRVRAREIGIQFRRWKLKLQKRRRSHTGRNSRWLLPPRSLIWIRLHSLLLLLIAIVTIGSFFEVIYVRFPFLCYFQSFFYLKQATQPVFSLVFLCLPSSCVVRTRRKIFFIWTNLVRENEEFFKTSLHNLHNVYKNVWNFYWDWFTTATS